MAETTTQQQPTMMAEPQKEHEWLQKLVGEWTCEMEMIEPGQATTKTTATEKVRSIGGLWTVAEGQGDMPGVGPTSMILTLGYNPQSKRFVGSFIASMTTHFWLYDGELDASERVLTLNSVGPSMAGDGSTAKYKDVIEIKDDDHRVLTSHLLDANGNWQQFMTIDYRRTK